MKEQVNWTIDEEIIPFITNEAKRTDRSGSFIVNEILKEYFDFKKYSPALLKRKIRSNKKYKESFGESKQKI